MPVAKIARNTILAKRLVVSVMLRTFAILINHTWEKTMSDQNTNTPEETIDFGDGVEYKVSDMTKTQLDILKQHNDMKVERNTYIQTANRNIEHLDILISYYADKLKKNLEAVDNAETEGGEDESSEH
tara:strand:- start:94 stop:477 length:384 start_codon:yes stop_codon:yes gene_type:complete